MASALAVPLAQDVWRIPTAPWDFINTVVFVEDDGSVTLVDCGLARAPARIVAGLAEIGKAPAEVQRIILTHAHADHAGGAARLRRETGAPVEIHEDDAAFASTGRVPPHDRSSLLGRLSNRSRWGGFEPVEVARTLVDGEDLPVAGGLRVVHTPGHTPGHVSLLHPRSGVLVTGDAIFNVRRLRWPVRAFCSDIAMTKKTAHLLADLDYDVAAFTHGPHVSDRAKEKVRAFLADVG